MFQTDMWKSPILATLLLLGWPFWPAGVSAQQDPAGRTLLATVVDRSGKAQVDFEADDFLISENGATREVLDVHIADYPLVLLIDDGDAMALPIIKRAAARFVARVGERPVVVGTLSNPDAIRATFEDDRQDVLDQIESIVPGASDAGLTLAATARGAQLLQDTGSPFSAIVAVSARAIDATQTVRGDLLPVILGSGATVHVVAGRPSAQDGAVPADVPDLLRVLADQSHGMYTAIFSTASYAIALDRLADRLATEMMVQYLVPAGSQAGDVRVGVRRPGSRVVGLGVSK